MAIIFIIIYCLVIKAGTSPTIIKSPTEKFTETKNLTFKGENITVEAASCDKFAWINPKTGEIISGILQESSPLGVLKCPNYYKSNKIVVQSSYWENISGWAEFKISTNGTYEVKSEMSQESKIVFGVTFGMLFLLIWGLIYIVVSYDY